mgnify:CR=1 FL=1
MPDDLDALIERVTNWHRENPVEDTCLHCLSFWPCDAAALLAAVATLRRERDECRASHFAKAEGWHYGDEVLGWKTRAEQAEARLRALVETIRELARRAERRSQQDKAEGKELDLWSIAVGAHQDALASIGEIMQPQDRP